MANSTKPVPRKQAGSILLPNHVKHVSFTRPSAAKTFDADALTDAPVDYADRYMPDDVTRDHARRMHYAAHRMHAAKRTVDVKRWQARYFALRDRIVIGNRKLIYRAVQRRMAVANRAEDMIGDCHIVLIHAVAAYNPWIGVRFSTYAYTCLVRALARQSQKLSNDWLARSIPLDALPDGEPRGHDGREASTLLAPRIDEFLRDDHPLLTGREKAILSLRFNLRETATNPTLETVGAELGLSKERVRQVQASAVQKLRAALADPISPVVA